MAWGWFLLKFPAQCYNDVYNPAVKETKSLSLIHHAPIYTFANTAHLA